MTKVISISDDAYKSLACIKNGNSFSEVILGLTGSKKKKSLYEYLKARGMDRKLADAFESAYRERKRYKLKDVTF